MDVNNERLKLLLPQTDSAFQALLQQPDSAERNYAYESAKQELDTYIASVRKTLTQRISSQL